MSSSSVPSDLAGRAASGRKLVAVVYADVVGYSRLIELDDVGTLEQLRALRNDLIDPEIERHGSQIIQTAGDSLLIVFDSITEAVHCAVDVQRKVPTHEEGRPSDRRVRFRVGIDLGDVIADGTDLHGNGVIVAVRLQAVCPAGSVCVSRSVRDHVRDRLDLSFEGLGELSLKNIARPVEAFALRLDLGAPPTLGRGESQRQDISYCRTQDGVRLAWARAGQGPPLVKTANWMNHLEYDWESPTWRHVFRGLSREHTLIRYDARGNGMSDWDVDELSLDAWVNDLETVVDAAGVERFPLLGISQGSAISVAFAVRHPERVSHLVLYGGFAVGGKKRAPAEKDRREAMTTLMRLGWGMDNPSFRQMFTGLFIPGATHEQADSFNELQRRTTSPECAARYFDVVGDFDIIDLLANVKAPTLVMHVRGDLIAPFEAGGGWLQAFAVPTSSLFRARIICSWNMSRPPTDSSKRLSCSSANEVTLRPISSRPGYRTKNRPYCNQVPAVPKVSPATVPGDCVCGEIHHEQDSADRQCGGRGARLIGDDRR